MVFIRKPPKLKSQQHVTPKQSVTQTPKEPQQGHIAPAEWDPENPQIPVSLYFRIQSFFIRSKKDTEASVPLRLRIKTFFIRPKTFIINQVRKLVLKNPKDPKP